MIPRIHLDFFICGPLSTHWAGGAPCKLSKRAVYGQLNGTSARSANRQQRRSRQFQGFHAPCGGAEASVRKFTACGHVVTPTNAQGVLRLRSCTASYAKATSFAIFYAKTTSSEIGIPQKSLPVSWSRSELHSSTGTRKSLARSCQQAARHLRSPFWHSEAKRQSATSNSRRIRSVLRPQYTGCCDICAGGRPVPHLHSQYQLKVPGP